MKLNTYNYRLTTNSNKLVLNIVQMKKKQLLEIDTTNHYWLEPFVRLTEIIQSIRDKEIRRTFSDKKTPLNDSILTVEVDLLLHYPKNIKSIVKDIKNINGKDINPYRIVEFSYRLFSYHNVYFYGCPIELYKSKYPKRLNTYLSNFNSLEIDFIEYELSNGIFSLDMYKDILTTPFNTLSLKRRFEFLQERANALGYSIEAKHSYHEVNKDDFKDREEFVKIKIDTPQPKENKEEGFPFYCQVGALFAQNIITRGKINQSYYYCFNNDKYNSLADIERAIQRGLNTDSSIRQYISDTTDNSGIKNLLDEPRKTKVIEYCKRNNIEIINPDFQ